MRAAVRGVWLALAAAGFVACGSPPNTVAGDGGADGGAAGDAAAAPDAATPGPDAGTSCALDTDGDSVSDADEGAPGRDSDGDGQPDFQDLDADGDGVLDADEAGDADPCTPPRDSDADGDPDGVEVDADGNGVPDGAETADTDGDGTPDFQDLDDDGDGAVDLIEWAAGSDPADPASVPGPGVFVVAPYLGAASDVVVSLTAQIQRTDVLFELDTTGSMANVINTLATEFPTVIAPNLAAEVGDLAMGVAQFKDFPVPPFGDAADFPFRLDARISTDLADTQLALGMLGAIGGGDGPESGIEALYQAVTGDGIAWTVTNAGAVPAFEPLVGYDPAKHGLLGGAGFREGALPVVVHVTDIHFHDAPEYLAAGIDEAHSRAQSVAAAQAAGVRFLGLTSDISARVAQELLAADTGAAVLPTAWGPGETMCHTGVGGALHPPNASGLCPLVFDFDWMGLDVDTQVVAAVHTLMTYGRLDVATQAVGDPASLPIDTAQFVAASTPVAPAPPGATIVGDTFQSVASGAVVAFQIQVHNLTVPSGAQPRSYPVTIRAQFGLVWLDEVTIQVIVPGGGP